MAQAGRNQLNVQDLTPEQLVSVKEQLDQELLHLTNSFGQLRGAIAKFTSGLEALDATQKKQGPVLVPLTASLYVPGQLSDPGRVLMDVGTGYFVDQSVGSARRCLNQKIISLGINLDQLQATIETKQEHLGLVHELIQIKTATQPPV